MGMESRCKDGMVADSDVRLGLIGLSLGPGLMGIGVAGAGSTGTIFVGVVLASRTPAGLVGISPRSGSSKVV